MWITWMRVLAGLGADLSLEDVSFWNCWIALLSATARRTSGSVSPALTLIAVCEFVCMWDAATRLAVTTNGEPCADERICETCHDGTWCVVMTAVM